MSDYSTPESAGAVTVGGRVTFFTAIDPSGKVVQVGEFPHCRMRRDGDKAPRCKAEMDVSDQFGTFSERCTRERRHGGVHVAHSAPGMPVLAWQTDAELAASGRTS